MPAFVSPLADPATWTLAIADDVVIPAGLRYAGYLARGLRATRAAAEAVQMPATGVLRKAMGTGTTVVVEAQVNPFPIRRVAMAIPGGIPTFYFVFDDLAGLTFADGDGALGGLALRTASAVTIVAIGQDRVARDPALWSAQLSAAIAAGGGVAAQWSPFATAVASATASGATAPVLLYDHAGRLRTSGAVDIVLGALGAETIHRATLIAADGGDLQRTVARLNGLDAVAMPIADLWGGGRTSFRLRPVPGAGGDVQLGALDSATAAAMEITVTPAQSSVAFTDLAAWFAPQSVLGLASGDLARYSRGNVVTTLVNGPEYFDDLFMKLQEAQTNGGFHLAGWAMFPQTKFTKRVMGDDPDATLTRTQADAQIGTDNVPLTLEQAAARIAAGGGQSRFLPAKFYQIADGSTVSTAEAVAFHLIMDALLILNAVGVRAASTDVVGTLLLMAAWFAATIYTAVIIADDAKPIEPNKHAVETLGTVAGTKSEYAPYPAAVDDNIPTVAGGFPFNAIFVVTRHFGIYHQKMAIVKAGTTFYGYCGGIDCNPDRLDDTDHLLKAPFHDVHARIEGAAVRDLALTFEQRWARDGKGVASAFGPPLAAVLPTTGADVVQIARTYFAPAAGGAARALAFASNGDRTIARTMIAAIEQAQELIYIEDQYLTPPTAYQMALIGKVTRGEIKQLIIAAPGLTDQPFGVSFRDSFLDLLIAADMGRGIVRVGYPRRRFTSSDNPLRASSGKLLLGQDLPAGSGPSPTIFLGPPSRLPALPFWVSVEGELMYVYDESTMPNAQPQQMKAFVVERGNDTRIVSATSGAYPRQHKAGAPATVVDLTNIYVHAKMMIVDDVFLGLGSANLNHRGLFYDGEINCFTIPEALRTSPRNPAFALRQRLWAEMMDLPAAMAASLLSDPIAAAKLFGRSPFAGNRFTPLDAQPYHLMASFTSSDTWVSNGLQALGFGIIAANIPALFAQVVDPSSRTETDP